jgi:hypothetical protein
MTILMTVINTKLTPDPVELIYNYDKITSFTEVNKMSKKLISVEIEKKTQMFNPALGLLLIPRTKHFGSF